MYVPAHFDEPRLEVLHDLIEKNPLGVLFTHGRSGLDANHLPFNLNAAQGKYGALQCHVARRNPIWQDVVTGDEVLVVFRAGDAYVSPNWYPTKHETGKQVPTWNYMVAHAYGRVTIHDDERYVRTLVARLTKTHESTQPRPWKMADSPRDYIDSLAKEIVGIEIEIRHRDRDYAPGRKIKARSGRGLARYRRRWHGPQAAWQCRSRRRHVGCRYQAGSDVKSRRCYWLPPTVVAVNRSISIRASLDIAFNPAANSSLAL